VINVRYLKEKTVLSYEVNKSVFIAILYPLETLDDLQLSLEDAKSLYPKANHYCSASLYGQNQEQQTASDDGEPSRTAGIPILEVLKHHDVTNILCVVVRYFGGIKLGSGGLVRAYTKACADAMKIAKFYEKIYLPSYSITFSYKHVSEIDHYLLDKADINEKKFTDVITYDVSLKRKDDNLDDIKHLFIRCTPLDLRLCYIDA
jgi:uncharacterized YigZ family protein